MTSLGEDIYLSNMISFFSTCIGSKERQKLTEALNKLKSSSPLDIPAIINGKEYRPNTPQLKQVSPFDHSRVLATFHETDASLTQKAIEGSLKAKQEWENMPFHARAAILLKVKRHAKSTEFVCDGKTW